MGIGLLGVVTLAALTLGEGGSSARLTETSSLEALTTEVRSTRDRLVEERPELWAPPVFMMLSALSGGAAGLVISLLRPGGGVVGYIVLFLEILLVGVLGAGHLAMGILGSVLLANGISRRSEIDDRLQQIDQVLRFDAGPAPAPVAEPPAALRPMIEVLR